jgi:hypothetical protein
MAASAALVASMPVAGQIGERELFDRATGVAITLPENWEFFTNKNNLRAFSEDRSATVFMMATEGRFGEKVLTVEETAGKRFFRNVEFIEATILMGRERGALEEAVFLSGKAVDREDGQPVQFAAMLVKSGDSGELIFGSWKDREHRDIVRQIVQSVRVRLPELESGLVLTDKRTGATITIPEQWTVHGARGGLLTYSPDRGAMTLIVRCNEGFQAKRNQVRDVLTQRVFESATVGKLTEFIVADSKGFGKLLAANGTATDRVTGEPAEFMVIVAERLDEQDSGVLILGAWKTDAYQEVVRITLKSLRLQ